MSLLLRKVLQVNAILLHVKCDYRDLDEIFSNDLYDTDINGDEDQKTG